MSFDYTASGDSGVLTLEGDLTIERVGALKEAFSNCMAQAKQVTVKLADVESLDLSCLQVLCSAYRSFDSQGKKLLFCHTGIEIVHQAAKRAGLMDKQVSEFHISTAC